MWKIIQKSPRFLMKYHLNIDHYEIIVSNYINIWSNSVTTKSLLKILQESNEGLELDNEEDFLKIGLEMLSNPEQLKRVSVVERDKDLEILMVKSHGFPIKFKLNFKLSSNECMFKEVIQPLLGIINDLRTSQSELRKELMKKDKEIEEYKCEGGEIALRHLKTVPYNDEAHMKRHSCYENGFGDSDIPDVLLEPIVCEKSTIQSKVEPSNNKINIKTEPLVLEEKQIKRENETTIKSEPLSQSDSVENPSTTSSNCDIIPKVETPRKRQRNKLNF